MPLWLMIQGVGAVATATCIRRRSLCSDDADGNWLRSDYERCALDASARSRVVVVNGSTPFKRGENLWRALGNRIKDLTNHRRRLYSPEGLAWWRAAATSCEEPWRRHAPTSWAETQGMVHAGANLSDLLLLATDFEMQMAAWSNPSFWRDEGSGSESGSMGEGGPAWIDAPVHPGGRCTAFAVTHTRCGPLCGQNVDEDGVGWENGARDAVIHFKAIHGPPGNATSSNSPTEPEAAVYTHPGVPAYCGMNSAGLCVLNLYLDASLNASGDPSLETHSPQAPTPRLPAGLPINVTIRELLRHRDLAGAVAWLESAERCSPAAYLLLQGSCAACVEATPHRSATLMVKGAGAEICHSNHALLDQRLIPVPNAPPPVASPAETRGGAILDGAAESPGFPTGAGPEVGVGAGSSECSTEARLGVVQRAVAAARSSPHGHANLDLAAAQRLLLACPPAHRNFAPTLASVVMAPQQHRMYVRFKGEDSWHEVSVAECPERGVGK
mmetsp:Transcript_62451/g.141197  ORF Transcript_62451/g.141197 Transcript_62451/m.141197 type:complete len:499 (+) Transcript_62451:34-1530(+)|eukprot:CAMPEP_0172610906 /NCGR_PEP_ID=MMETSP1068-20121228/30651_1 /TAXON_ID=35684 /ORGANISM="Pseudopedinella elastica, Strain CCMP716" /LENGTH=498 /DNA_ID=CAMNT_0013414727 /DNA_START=26 /DNA_END=1522 /DNA_ORIENTATION=+